VQYSDGSQFFSPAALESFPTAGNYAAQVSVTDQFGATDSTTVSFSIHNGIVDNVRPLETPELQQQEQQCLCGRWGRPRSRVVVSRRPSCLRHRKKERARNISVRRLGTRLGQKEQRTLDIARKRFLREQFQLLGLLPYRLLSEVTGHDD
jgi:hypothetical protein